MGDAKEKRSKRKRVGFNDLRARDPDRCRLSGAGMWGDRVSQNTKQEEDGAIPVDNCVDYLARLVERGGERKRFKLANPEMSCKT